MELDSNLLRFSVFLFGLVFFSLLEVFFSYRKRVQTRQVRWTANLGLILCSSFLLKVMIPAGLAYFSTFTQKHSLGLFNTIELGGVIELMISFIILDFIIYIQHVISHKVDFFWRFHKVHHTDSDLDATSALRFHPVEILLSVLYKALWVVLLGFSLESILLFEIVLNFCALFNHANLFIPASLEKVIRLFIVTPQMHIIHHSIEGKESLKNYSFCLSLWDKVFNTYQDQFQSAGVIGVKDTNVQRLINLLKLPFTK